MKKTLVVHARIEARTKKRAESVLRQLGMTAAGAIRLFYRQICLRSGLPFPLLIPNRLTRKTMEKSRRGEDIDAFESLEQMFESWEK